MIQSIFSKETQESMAEEIVSLVTSTLGLLTERTVKQEYFRPEEAAVYCGTSAATISKWEEYGLDPIKIKGIKLYSKSDLDEFILKHKF